MLASRRSWNRAKSSRLSFVGSGRKHDARRDAFAIDKLCAAMSGVVLRSAMSVDWHGYGRDRQETAIRVVAQPTGVKSQIFCLSKAVQKTLL